MAFGYSYTLTSGTVIESAKVSQNLTDAKTWVTDTNAVYKTIFQARGALSDAATANTYYFVDGAAAAVVSGTQSSVPATFFYFDDADYLVGSLTPKLRLRAQVATNTVQPLITFTLGLYPITVAGAADQITVTLGTVVASSTVAIASPASSTVTSGVNSDFTIPPDGAYALGVVTSGTVTADARVNLSCQLQTRNV